MIAASQKYNRLVQGGTQRRSNGYFRRAVQALREGVIGDVYMARCIHYQLRDSSVSRVRSRLPRHSAGISG